MTVRRRIVAHGRVQGVFFRESTRRLAASRGVSGWAVNHPDGTVEAVFEGSDDAVASVVEAVRRGPGNARVKRLEVAEEPPEGLDGFEIR